MKEFKHEDLPPLNEFQAMLIPWENLKIIRIHNEELSIKFDFKCCKSIKQVICPKPNYMTEDFMAPWASLTWITYNPFSSSSPTLTGSIIPENGIQKCSWAIPAVYLWVASLVVEEFLAKSK